jgi:hypothetical protein
MSNKQKSSIKNAFNNAKEDMSICLIGPPGCGKSGNAQFDNLANQ